MPIHNKLVRDGIPDIIAKTGKNLSTRILEQEDYTRELKKKIYEELEEYMNAQTNEEALEELADILEVIYALAQTHDSSPKLVEEIRKDKAGKRGGFHQRVFLIEVEDI